MNKRRYTTNGYFAHKRVFLTLFCLCAIAIISSFGARIYELEHSRRLGYSLIPFSILLLKLVLSSAPTSDHLLFSRHPEQKH